MNDLEHLMPDEDRREQALENMLLAVHRMPERTDLTAQEIKVLQAFSFGLDSKGVSYVLGMNEHNVMAYRKKILRALRAKNTTHAVAEGLRQKLII